MEASDEDIYRKRVMRWIDSHYRPEPTVDNGNGTLAVATSCVAKNGAFFIEYDVIPATMNAARDLLGY